MAQSIITLQMKIVKCGKRTIFCSDNNLKSEVNICRWSNLNIKTNEIIDNKINNTLCLIPIIFCIR